MDGDTPCLALAEIADYSKLRKRPNIPLVGVRCQIEGVLESICVPLLDLKKEVSFCYDDLYPYVCRHVFHPLWPDWTVQQKDFEI